MLRFLFSILFSLLISFAVSQAQLTPEQQKLTTKAYQYVGLFLDSSYAEAVPMQDSTMKAKFSAEVMASTRSALTKQVGQLKKIGESRYLENPPYRTVIITTDFDLMPLDIKVVFDKAEQVSGFFFTPAAGKVKYEIPTYVDTTKFYEQAITVNGPPWELPGILTIPKGAGSFPALILVHGSGPNDLDETVGPNKPFRDLAWGLSSQGIAVLRYDKRTKAHPDEYMKIKNSTVKDEVIDDAVAAFKLCRSEDHIAKDKVYLLGHSLGGYLMPRIALKCPEAAGFIIMAGAARPLEDLIIEQYTYIFNLNDTIDADEQKTLDEITKQADLVKSDSLTLETPDSLLPLGASASYWLDLKKYNPAEMVKSVKQPLLIIQGARDYQVTDTDFKIWEKALEGRKNVTFKEYSDFNHLFMVGEGMATPSEYMQPGHVAVKVIDDIASWIK